jgi:hypothetical protein
MPISTSGRFHHAREAMDLFDRRCAVIAAERRTRIFGAQGLAQDTGEIFSDPALRPLVISSLLWRGMIARSGARERRLRRRFFRNYQG